MPMPVLLSVDSWCLSVCVSPATVGMSSGLSDSIRIDKGLQGPSDPWIPASPHPAAVPPEMCLSPPAVTVRLPSHVELFAICRESTLWKGFLLILNFKVVE
ncbi:uncharacterized protein LOC144576519 [Callithrix jacchus]